jgi:phosphate transport system permease protein
MVFLTLLLVLAAAAFYLGRSRAVRIVNGNTLLLHSRPGHYGWWAVLLSVGPALTLWCVWRVLDGWALERIVASRLSDELRQRSPAMLEFFFEDVRRIANGQAPVSEDNPALRAAGEFYGRLQSYGELLLWAIAATVLILGFAYAYRRIAPQFRARVKVERFVAWMLLLGAAISILTTAGIVFSVLFESILFFQRVPVWEFLFGLHWSPQTAIRADQVASSGAFGAVPLFAGTFLITVIAMLVAGPIGLLSAIYLSEYATPSFRSASKPILEVLAGIPTVVYGFFAALTVAPFIRDFGSLLGLGVSSESALAAGGVMGIMIIPFVSSLSDDALTAVPQSLREASYGLGATRAETVRKVILPAALPGVIAGFLLAVSRAIGETMIVVMAAGLAANLTANPFEAVTTVTVQIVTLLVGDQEFDSAKTLAAFALGLVLFVSTLMLNVVALYVLKTYREKYD